MTPDPIEELRKWLKVCERAFESDIPVSLVRDALAAYDAKCDEVERLKGELEVTKEALKIESDWLNTKAKLDTANAQIESARGLLEATRGNIWVDRPALKWFDQRDAFLKATTPPTNEPTGEV